MLKQLVQSVFLQQDFKLVGGYVPGFRNHDVLKLRQLVPVCLKNFVSKKQA